MILPLQTQDLAQDSTLVLGVSGGRDSMALLHALRAQRPDLTIVAAHVNHGLRSSAEAETQLVHNTLQTWQIPLHIKTLTPPKKGNIENWARTERYHFFQTLALQVNATAVVTAHHQNDDLESILLHLLRGTRLKGLSGIKLCTPFQPLTGEPSKASLFLVRPLLFTPRSAIDQYVRDQKIPYADDPSNQDLSLSRNFLRHEILPKLEHLTPEWGTRLQGQKSYWIALQAHLEQEAQTFLSEHLHPQKGLARTPYTQHPLPLRYTILELWFKASTGLAVPDSASLDRWDSALCTWSSGKKTEWGPFFLKLSRSHAKLTSLRA